MESLYFLTGGRDKLVWDWYLQTVPWLLMTIVLHASEKKCQTQTPYFFSWDELPDLLFFLQDRQGTIYRLHIQTPIQNIQAGGF